MQISDCGLVDFDYLFIFATLSIILPYEAELGII